MVFNTLISPSMRLTPSSGFTLVEKMVIVAILGIFASISAPGVWGMLNRAKLKQTVAEVRTALNETQREAIRGNKICTVTLNFVKGKVTGSCLKTGDRNLATEVTIATNLTGNNSSPVTQKGQKGLVVSDSQSSQGFFYGSQSSLIALTPKGQGNRASNAGMVVQVISQCQTNAARADGLGRCGTYMASDFVGDEDAPASAPRSSPVSTYDIPIRYGVLGNPEFSIVDGGTTPADPSGKIVFFFADDTQGKKHCIAISNTLGLTRVGTYSGNTTPLSITNSGRCTAENWEKQ